MILYVVLSSLYTICAMSVWSILGTHFHEIYHGTAGDIKKAIVSLFWFPVVIITIVDIAINGVEE